MDAQQTQQLIDNGQAVLFVLPTFEECDFDAVWHEEDSTPDGSFDFAEDIAWVKDQLESGNEWAWCTVEVTCTYDDCDLVGNEWLGGCSYKSKRDFMREETGDYYPGMKQEAYNDLINKIKRAAGITV